MLTPCLHGSDDLYETLKEQLLERATDREASVRVQAVVALAKLQQSSGEQDADEEEDEVGATLLHLLRHDAAAEVRRAALFNLSLTPAHLPSILERLRDVDVVNRRCVFLGSLALLAPPAGNKDKGKGKDESAGAGTGAAVTGLLLNKAMTSDAIGAGLKDREESVRRSAKKLMSTWIDTCDGDLEEVRDACAFSSV